MNFLCIVAIFKNESEIIEEWIEHYIKQGVEKFFLIDNGSTDDYQSKIKKFDENLLEIIIDDLPYSQIHHYNSKYLEKCKKYKWALVCDLDEFVYARNGFKNIVQYLKIVSKEVSQIAIPWKMFGSNGYNTLDKLQPIKVVENFTKRANYNNFSGIMHNLKGENYTLMKCIVKTINLKKLLVHRHNTKKNNNISSTDLLQTSKIDSIYIKIDENILNDFNLHLNHYCVQSLDWFMRIKAKRGSCQNKNQNNLRNEEYFHSYDKLCNDIEDNELKIYLLSS